MANRKKDEFSDNENELADLAKAIGYPARVAILKRIAKKKSCNCGQLVDELPINQATVSHHLAELLKLNLITRTPEGLHSIYAINWRSIDKFERNMNFFFTKLNTGNPKFN